MHLFRVTHAPSIQLKVRFFCNCAHTNFSICQLRVSHSIAMRFHGIVFGEKLEHTSYQLSVQFPISTRTLSIEII
jgi:hypothetical protein